MSGESEDISTRHRRERKELQNEIQALKKSCLKGDKKKKKEVLDDIVRLELALEQKHEKELKEVELNSKDENADEEQMSEGDENAGSNEVRITKAQKRRNKKAAEEREREERIISQEIQNKNGPRNKELQEIKRILKEGGLQLYNIPADGNCLYCAVDHQLDMTSRQSYSVPVLRKMTATYMREHKDDFLPFMMHNDEDKVFTEDMYEEYCKSLENKPIWGGQIEIRALSSLLKCPIKVIQANSGATIQGEEYDGSPLVLSYHRHLYRLGEHYNSTMPLELSDDDN